VLTQQNAHEPAGQISDDNTTRILLQTTRSPMQINTSRSSSAIRMAAIRLADVADVSDGAQNIRTAGYLNGTSSITVMIFRQPGANIISTSIVSAQNCHQFKLPSTRHQNHNRP